MTASDFFYVSVGLTAWVVIGVAIWVGAEAVKTLQSVRRTADNVKGVTRDILVAKSNMQAGWWSMIANILGKLSKGGDKND